jgi:hypothetical protein
MITPCRKKVNLLQSAVSRKINSLNYLKQRREGTLLGGRRTTTSSGPGSHPPVIPSHCRCTNFISNSLQSILCNAYLVTPFRSLSPFLFSFSPSFHSYMSGLVFRRSSVQIVPNAPDNSSDVLLIFCSLSKWTPVGYDNLRYEITNFFHSRLHFLLSWYSIIKLLVIKLLQKVVLLLETDSRSGGQDFSGF